MSAGKQRSWDRKEKVYVGKKKEKKVTAKHIPQFFLIGYIY